MMLRKHRDNEPELPKDVDIERWFQVLGEPPEAHEPPGARLRMLARIAQPKKRFTFATPALAMGLAAGLLLSLGLNLWSGNGFFGFNRQETQQVAHTRTGLPTYRFQTYMQPSATLRTQVAARLPDAPISPVVAFASQIPPTTFFRIGRLHADALAALHSRAVDSAHQYLTWLQQALTSAKAPLHLSNYLSFIQRYLQEHPGQIDQARWNLAGFESLYQETYATDPPSARLLFELGAWSENLYLASATGDVQAVQQGVPRRNLRRGLRMLNLPPESLAALDRLEILIDKPNLSASDLTAVRTQVQQLQDRVTN